MAEAHRRLRGLVTVVPVDGNVIDRAIDSRFADVEDAIQYCAALEKGVSAIVTRSTKDVARSRSRVCTAEESVAGMEDG